MREFASLFQAPSPAVLMTYRKDGTVAASPSGSDSETTPSRSSSPKTT